MDVRQCRNCRKLFQYRGNPLCPVCVNELDKLFETVRNYIYDNPQSTIDEICNETEVTRATITSWLRDGRLILSAENASLLQCESCGEPIRTGRFCEKCSSNVKSQLESAAQSMAPKQEPKEKKQVDRNNPRMHVDFRKK